MRVAKSDFIRYTLTNNEGGAYVQDVCGSQEESKEKKEIDDL